MMIPAPLVKNVYLVTAKSVIQVNRDIPSINKEFIRPDSKHFAVDPRYRTMFYVNPEGRIVAEPLDELEAPTVLTDKGKNVGGLVFNPKTRKLYFPDPVAGTIEEVDVDNKTPRTLYTNLNLPKKVTSNGL